MFNLIQTGRAARDLSVAAVLDGAVRTSEAVMP
jgi:hypothetical protein